jgi:capsular polysaccharide biosynthesis protein
VETPVVPQVPSEPSRTLNMAIAGILGLFVGVFAAFFKLHGINIESFYNVKDINKRVIGGKIEISRKDMGRLRETGW